MMNTIHNVILRDHEEQYRFIKQATYYRTLVEKPEGKGPLGRPRRRWVDYIRMDITDKGWDGMDWIDLA
jgi:hypothetical protein